MTVLRAKPAARTSANGHVVRSRVPAHVALIMDGNGRWAEAQGRDRHEGHEAGYRNIERVIETLGTLGVRYVTLFGFSTENWGRPDEEVSGLLDLLALGLEEQVQRLHERNVRIRHIGRADRVSASLRDGIRKAVGLTAGNAGLTLCVAFDYGGRQDIVNAVHSLIENGARPEDVTEETLSKHLYTAGVPDPDLVVRTGGEFRISNFLLWQSAYSEFYSAPVNWPDFDDKQIGRALEAYSQRKRRFGRVE